MARAHVSVSYPQLRGNATGHLLAGQQRAASSPSPYGDPHSHPCHISLLEKYSAYTHSSGARERRPWPRTDQYVTLAADDSGQHACQVGNLSDFDMLSGQFMRGTLMTTI